MALTASFEVDGRMLRRYRVRTEGAGKELAHLYPVPTREEKMV
jgi:hypothetical protein